MPRERGLISGVASHGARRAEGRRAQRAWTSALAMAAALAAAAPGAAATLREVRIGRHAEYTRIVFETDAPVRYRVTRDSAGELRVRLEATASPRRVGSKSEVVREVAVESEGTGSVARLALQRGEFDVREMVLDDPPRIVLDLMPRAGAATAVADRTKSQPAAREALRREPAALKAPASVARAKPEAPAPAPAAGVASVRATPSPAEASAPPRLGTPTPAPELATVRPAPSAAEGAAVRPVAKVVDAATPRPEPSALEAATVQPETKAGPVAVVAPQPSAGEVATVEPGPRPGEVAALRPEPKSAGPPAEPKGAEPPAGPRAVETPAPVVARAPAPAPVPSPRALGEAGPAREAPLELQLVSPGGSAVADDPAAARLAKAERDLEKLAGIPAKPRRQELRVAEAAPVAQPREPAPQPAPAPMAAPEAAAPTAVAAGAPPMGSAPPTRAATAPAPAAAGTSGPATAPDDARAALAKPAPGPAGTAEPGPGVRPEARKAKSKRAHAPFQPTAPLAPSPLAFLPSPFDDPLVLTGIGALIGLIGALAIIRRRVARADEGFASPFDAAEVLEPDLAGGVHAHGAGTAAFEPVSASPVAPPTAEMGPLFASATVVEDEEEPSIFDVTAEEAAPEDADTPSVPAPPAFEPAAPALGATAPTDTDETELTEEEMRLIEELERRLAHLETRLEEVVDAKERLERHVAAQTEELRVQRAAIARTQRVLRTVVKPDDVATEPVAKP